MGKGLNDAIREKNAREKDQDRLRLVVRERDAVRYVEPTEDWTTTTMVGALSAEPTTFDELMRACLRYRPLGQMEQLDWRQGDDPPPEAINWLLIDLPNRRVVAKGDTLLPEDPQIYDRSDDDPRCEGDSPSVWIHLPPDWRRDRVQQWTEGFEPLKPPHEPLDVRGVLYGRPLIEFLAAGARNVANGEELPERFIDWEDPIEWTETHKKIAWRWDKVTKKIHADWLMTPREDLDDQTPREFLHRGRDWLMAELEQRMQQWSQLGAAPRPLDRDTYAYRYGPLGTHEVVMYWEFCRCLLATAWKSLLERPDLDETELGEILVREGDRWLETPRREFDQLSPKQIIDLERRRLPLALCSEPKPLDDQSQTPLAEWDEPHPTFLVYDGCRLEQDAEFAFSLEPDYDEWKWQYGDPEVEEA